MIVIRVFQAMKKGVTLQISQGKKVVKSKAVEITTVMLMSIILR